MSTTEVERGVRKTREGVVISNKMQKTIVVQVSRRVRHPRYGKEMITSKKYYAHDEGNEAGPGDTVRIVETRPLSRLKRWRLLAIVTKAAKTA
jgi:small subunit ribosomal protein S17